MTTQANTTACAPTRGRDRRGMVGHGSSGNTIVGEAKPYRDGNDRLPRHSDHLRHYPLRAALGGRLLSQNSAHDVEWRTKRLLLLLLKVTACRRRGTVHGSAVLPVRYGDGAGGASSCTLFENWKLEVINRVNMPRWRLHHVLRLLLLSCERYAA